jgi:hypothetical protein
MPHVNGLETAPLERRPNRRKRRMVQIGGRRYRLLEDGLICFCLLRSGTPHFASSYTLLLGFQMIFSAVANEESNIHFAT